MKPPVVYLNGKFVKLENARVSVLDRGFAYGDGLFETMRAYEGTVLRLDLHLERLLRGAKSIYLKLPLDRSELAETVRETRRINGIPNASIRLTITRGVALPGLAINPSATPTIIVYVQPVQPLPRRYYRKGVEVSLFPDSACKIGALPEQIKSCNYLSAILIREMAAANGAFEGILLDGKNRVTEGTVSNIFAVKGGVITTPKPDRYVLPGVTRRIVLDIAKAAGLPTVEKTLKPHDIYRADEVFLTNTGIEILPVTKADGKKIGTGIPGGTTRLLHKYFLKMLEGLS